MLLFFSIQGFVFGIIFTILGLLVLLNNPKRRLNRLYAFFSLAAIFWSTSYGFWLLSKDYNTALFWARMLNFGAIFVPISFSHWILLLLDIDKEKRNKIILFFGYLLTLALAVVGFSPYYVSHVEPQLFFPYWPMPGILHPFYLLFGWGGLIGYSIYRLWKAYKKTSGYKQTQLKYVLVSIIFAFGGASTNFLLWYGIPLAPWGNPLIVIWPIILSYTILRYRLMDIRWILGRTGIYALSFLTILLYVSALFFLNQDLGSIVSPIVLDIFTAVTSILLFLYFFRFFERIAGKYFYYTYYNLKLTLQRLSRQLNQTIELDKLTNLINRSLLDALNLDKIGVILKPKEKTFFPQALIKLKEEDIFSLLTKEQGFLSQYLQKEQKPLVREEIPFLIEEVKKQEAKIRSEREEKEVKETIIKLSLLREEMEKMEIAVFLPLLVEEELIGIIILGNKLSQEAYTVQDLDLLTTLASQASIAFNNALSYSEIERRKADLEKFYKLTVGRELKMVELKREIKKLEEKLRERE